MRTHLTLYYIMLAYCVVLKIASPISNTCTGLMFFGTTPYLSGVRSI